MDQWVLHQATNVSNLAVSYTHLDVYKRQMLQSLASGGLRMTK